MNSSMDDQEVPAFGRLLSIEGYHKVITGESTLCAFSIGYMVGRGGERPAGIGVCRHGGYLIGTFSGLLC